MKQTYFELFFDFSVFSDKEDKMQDWLSVVVIVGIVVIFLPQQIRIVRKQSSLGISPHFVLSGLLRLIRSAYQHIDTSNPGTDRM